jgi:hypothetical protein
MKAILIDSKNETVTEVEISNENSLQDWYKKLGCQMVEVAHYFDEHDSIMVDEEGLLSMDSDTKFFTVVGGHQPFAGNGLVVGVDDEGESVDCNKGVDEIKSLVKFFTLSEIQRKYKMDMM